MDEPVITTLPTGWIKQLEDLYALRDKTKKQREEIEKILGGGEAVVEAPKKQREAQKCSICQQEGHLAQLPY
jgi:hypothetical protein